MTQEDILEMAREAGMADVRWESELSLLLLTRFARLVAAAEREACAAQKQQQVKLVAQNWQSELLDLVSACQSAYHIDNTAGHRFGGIGSNLEDNRSCVVEFVGNLLHEIVAKERTALLNEVADMVGKCDSRATPRGIAAAIRARGNA